MALRISWSSRGGLRVSERVRMDQLPTLTNQAPKEPHMPDMTHADEAAEHLRQQIARDTSSVTAPGWETQNAIGHLLDEHAQHARDHAHKRD